jgi:hypothetical protein
MVISLEEVLENYKTKSHQYQITIEENNQKLYKKCLDY